MKDNFVPDASLNILNQTDFTNKTIAKTVGVHGKINENFS